MKITIELEIQPDEVNLAAELLSTLRSLTDHVKVVTPGAATAAAAPTGPSLTPTGAPAAPVPSPAAPSAVPNGGQAAAAPQPSHPAHQATSPASAAPAPALAPAAPTAAPAPAPQGGLQGTPQPFVVSIPRLAIPAEFEQASADIIATLRAAGDNLDNATEELVAAYEQCVFNNRESLATGAIPFMSLYPRMPDDLRQKFRDKLVAKVLTTLARKRPVDIDRTSFFSYADAFAALVKFEAVPLDGAVQTLSRLLSKPDSRAAGVTMLGKTIEYCGAQVLATAQPHLLALFRALETVREETFAYDMQYITNSLGFTPAAAPGAPAAGAAAAAAPAAPGTPAGPPAAAAAPALALAGATHVGGYVGHQAAVFSLCWDPLHGQLTSGGQDGQLVVWGHDGSPAGRIEVPNLYVCSLDVLPRSGTILAAAVPMDPSNTSVAASILAFSPPAGAAPGQPRVGGWTPRGRIFAANGGYASIVRALPGDGEMFVTGESIGEDVVCLYDITQASSLESVTPVSTYREHADMVTCAAAWYGNPCVFATGSKDKTILVWDRRLPKSVGTFGEHDAASGKLQAHTDMLTWLDCTADNLLLSSCVDGTLGVWDFRALGMTHGSAAGVLKRVMIDQQPVLKLAVTGAPHSRMAAVSTYSGLYAMDFTDLDAPRVVAAAPPPDRPFKSYHDIRWAGGPGAPGQALLFAASEDPRIDIYAISFA